MLGLKWPCKVVESFIIIEIGGIGDLGFCVRKSDKLVPMSEIVAEFAPSAKNPFFQLGNGVPSVEKRIGSF